MDNLKVPNFENFPKEALISIHDFIVSSNYQAYTIFFISGVHILSDYFATLPIEQFTNPSFWADSSRTSIFDDLPSEFAKLPEQVQKSKVKESIKCLCKLKDYLQIPLTCDIGELDFESFYTPKAAGFSSVRDFGASIIAPDISLHTIPKDERIVSHDALFEIMIKNLYEIDGMDIYDDDIKRKTREILIKYRNDFVTIRHISNTNNLFAAIRIPAYLTSFQFEELEKLNSILKQLNVKTHISYVGSFSLSSTFPPLEQVLEFIKVNGYIKENELPLKRRTDSITQNRI